MKMTKELYPSFLKNYKLAQYVGIKLATTQEIDRTSWAAPATATITLDWTTLDGAKCTYTAEFAAQIVYAVDGGVANVGHIQYSTMHGANSLAYLFKGLSKDGDITFRLEIMDTLRKTATKLELSAHVYAGKEYYPNVPVETSVTTFAHSLYVGKRSQPVT